MTLRRGISLALTITALVAYGLTRLPSPSIAPSIVQTSSAGGGFTIITEPSAGMAPIRSMIASASSSIDLVMYQLEDADMEQALADAAARGVHVRVLLNGGYYGTKENTKNDAAYQFLSQHGVAVHWTPSYFALTHEKSFVLDGTTAVIMTMNMTPQYYASGREFGIVDTDPHDVSAVETTFDQDWNGEKVAASNGDDLIWSPGSENALVSLIASARTSLDIYNEEMADTKITSALADAAHRGVAVRVIMTYASEWKSAFTTLSQAGAQVRTYSVKAPLYIHAKVIMIDGARAFVGSENFSTGSLQKNRELGLILSDPAYIGSIEQTFDTDWIGATPFSG